MIEEFASPGIGPADHQSTTGAQPEDVRVEVARLREQLAACNLQASERVGRHTLAGKELQHRARNTIALIRSAFSRTMQTGRSLQDVEMHFCGRLDVLAQYMLPHSDFEDGTVEVEDVVREELRNFQFGEAPGITIDGPRAKLSLEQGQSFALMIHELATNALKFGALSIDDAALRVTWEISDGKLKLAWSETGVPIVLCAPVPRGFGQEYIEEALPYQIAAATQFMLKPGGVLCTIEFQLACPQLDQHTGCFPP